MRAPAMFLLLSHPITTSWSQTIGFKIAWFVLISCSQGWCHPCVWTLFVGPECPNWPCIGERIALPTRRRGRVRHTSANLALTPRCFCIFSSNNKVLRKNIWKLLPGYVGYFIDLVIFLNLFYEIFNIDNEAVEPSEPRLSSSHSVCLCIERQQIGASRHSRGPWNRVISVRLESWMKTSR